MVVHRASQGSGNAARLTALLLCVMVVMDHASAAQVQVGGSPGWLLGVKYNSWLGSAKIRAKDTLLFKYPAGQHNVVQVTAKNYKSCTTSNGLKYLSSGNDKFTVSKPGTYYFICGVADHCKKGMKVAITVPK